MDTFRSRANTAAYVDDGASSDAFVAPQWSRAIADDSTSQEQTIGPIVSKIARLVAQITPSDVWRWVEYYSTDADNSIIECTLKS